MTRQFVLRYDAAWQPIDMTVDAVARGAGFADEMMFAEGKAISEITTGRRAGVQDRKVTPDMLGLPHLFFSAYEALAMRLASIPDGDISGLHRSAGQITIKQTARSTQKIETAGESSTYARTR